MQGRSFILRCAAFFLLLIFLQKNGAGLLLHHAFHTSQAENKSISIACNCIDDFLMPFAEPVEPAVAAVVEKHEVAVSFSEDILFYAPEFTSLRGPPSYVLIHTYH